MDVSEMKFVVLNTNASLYPFSFSYQDVQIYKIQELEKQKVLKYYVTITLLWLSSFTAFSVHQTNEALSIKVVCKQQLFLVSQTDTYKARK